MRFWRSAVAAAGRSGTAMAELDPDGDKTLGGGAGAQEETLRQNGAF